MPAVDQQQPAKGERPLASFFFKEFGGVYTKSDRSAVPKGKFANLINLMQIGDANLRTVPDASALLYTTPSNDPVIWSQFVIITTTAYQVLITASGKAFVYNWATGANSQINSAHVFTGSARCAQFMNLYVLFIDTSGYFYWDGTNFNAITGTGVPTSGTDICTYAGRVWICSGRLLQFCADYDGTSTTDPTQASSWLTANGAGFVNFTDPVLTGTIQRLTAQNGYLFVAGSTCLYSISNLYVPAGTPPTPVMTIFNVQAINGTDQPASMVPYGNHMIFGNRYGGWVTDGAEAEQLSEDIDGTWQYLSSVAGGKLISAGQCVVNNKLCAAFLLTLIGDPVQGTVNLLAMYFDKKWWFALPSAFTDTITLISTAIINSKPVLVLFAAGKMYTNFSGAAAAPGTAVTPLWDMDDPLSAKEVVRAGARVIFLDFAGNVTLSCDGLNSSTQIVAGATQSTMFFIGADGNPLVFSGTGAITWITIASYQLVNGDGLGIFSGNVGFTLKTTGGNMQIALFAMDYKKANRWPSI